MTTEEFKKLHALAIVKAAYLPENEKVHLYGIYWVLIKNEVVYIAWYFAGMGKNIPVREIDFRLTKSRLFTQPDKFFTHKPIWIMENSKTEKVYGFAQKFY